VLEAGRSGDFYAHWLVRIPSVRSNLTSVRESLIGQVTLGYVVLIRKREWIRVNLQTFLFCVVKIYENGMLLVVFLIKAGKVSMGMKYIPNFM